MNKAPMTAAIVLALGLMCAQAWAQPDDMVANGRNAAEDAAGSFIFVFDPAPVKPDDVPGLAKGLAAQHGGSIKFTYKNTIRGFAARMSEEAAEKLAANNPNILYYEKDQVAWAIDRPVTPNKKCASPPCDNTSEPTSPTPTGPCEAEAIIGWNIERVGGHVDVEHDPNFPYAWIIDTGIDTKHPELNVNPSLGENFVAWGKNSVEDGHGHGTHVAGIVAAKDCENGEDVVGVAAGATVIPVRVLDNNGSGSYSGVIAGIDYVAEEGNANPGDCANMSLGGGKSDAVNQAVEAAAAKGILFSLAAGNESTNASTRSPASANGDNIYTVSASDEFDNWASFSNYGNPPVDFAAPGVSIKSTYKRGGYATWSGTSMAAPHVCGLLLRFGTNLTSDGVVDGDPDNEPDPIAHTPPSP